MHQSIFIHITESTKNWVIGSIANDIKTQLISMGHICDFDSNLNDKHYDVSLSMSYAYAKTNKNAKHNSVFVTHIDDKFKELLVKNNLKEFDSILCMSSDDAKTLISMGLSEDKVLDSLCL